MSTQVPSEPMASPGAEDSPLASGLTVFAAAMMMIGGVWHALAGIAALVHDDIYVTTPEYIYSFDLTVSRVSQLRGGCGAGQGVVV